MSYHFVITPESKKYNSAVRVAHLLSYNIKMNIYNSI